MNILLAETDRSLALNLKAALEHAGFDVMIVHLSLEAWDLLSGATLPDLLITRIKFGLGQLPGTAIGARAWSNGVQVIYIPLNGHYAAHAVEGHGGVLVKPFETSALVNLVKRVMAGADVGEHAARRRGAGRSVQAGSFGGAQVSPIRA